jgi:uncharacterized membrane protein
MTNWEQYLSRWTAAGLLDEEAARRIRAFEAGEERPAGHRWQVLIALILGGILLGAGVLLFVAAHWDQVSPTSRLLLVVGILALLHAGGIAAAGRFDALATVLHGVGTVAAGGAIAMVGQIFNMQEHWPGAVMLWALCAAAGYGLLRDQFQQICLMLLAPAWLLCEWGFYAGRYPGSDIYLARMIAALAAVYLTAFVHSRRAVVFGVLFGAAAVALAVTTGLLSEGWLYPYNAAVHPMPWSFRMLAIAFLVLCVGTTAWRSRRTVLPVLAVIAMSYLVPWLRTTITEQNQWARQPYTHSIPSVLMYVVVALTTVYLAWWAVQQRSRAVVNYAVAMFAVTVMWFYFSSLMDKMNRSLGLIGLGLLFLLGGWMLERLRRQLMVQMKSQPSEGGAA